MKKIEISKDGWSISAQEVDRMFLSENLPDYLSGVQVRIKKNSVDKVSSVYLMRKEDVDNETLKAMAMHCYDDNIKELNAELINYTSDLDNPNQQ